MHAGLWAQVHGASVVARFAPFNVVAALAVTLAALTPLWSGYGCHTVKRVWVEARHGPTKMGQAVGIFEACGSGAP